MDEEDDKPARRSIGARRNPETEEAILEAAEEVLQEAGYTGFSIEAVARRARAGKPTIYRWWRGKADLLLDVYRRQKGDFPFPDTGDLEKDLARFAGMILHYWRTNPSGQIFRSILAEAQHDEVAAEGVKAYALDRRTYMAGMVKRAQDRGDVAPNIDPELVAELVQSFVWTRLFTDREEASEEELGAVMRIIVRGVAHEQAGTER